MARASRGGSRLLLAVVLLGIVGLGLAVSLTLPVEGSTMAQWPVGLAAGFLVLLRRSRPDVGSTAVTVREVAGVLVVGVVGAATLLLGPRPDATAVGFGVAAAASAWVAARVLDPDRSGRPRLRDDGDLRRYLAAAGGGALTGGVVAGTAAGITGSGHAAWVALLVTAAQLGSHLSLLPLFARMSGRYAVARGGERLLQWVLVLGGVPLVLSQDGIPSLAFLVIPLLAWAALRVSPPETLTQLGYALFVAAALTAAERGAFADAPGRYGLDVDVRGLLVSAFVVSCAIVTVPLMLRAGEYLSAARRAASERDLVRGIVDGASATTIIATDEIGRITLFNPAAESMLGYRAEDVVGRFATMLHSRDAISEKAAELGVADDFVAVMMALVQRRLVGTPIRYLHGDGTERIHAFTLTALSDGTGRDVGYVGTSRDVTDELRAQQALREALDAEREAGERLREVDAVKDQFVSTVSHELRTPITSIVGYLELLADGDLGPMTRAQCDAVSRISGNSERLLQLIDDLLTLSRLSHVTIQADATATVFDLREAVQTAYRLVAPSWRQHRRLDTTLDLPSDVVPVAGSRDMLERVVVNLIENAVKFTEDGGHVRVGLGLDPQGRAMIVVRDTGMGIPEAEQSQLFSRFFRSSLAEQRQIPGTGLGLSIARAIVDQHGGRISVESATGEGTRVAVELPTRRDLAG